MSGGKEAFRMTLMIRTDSPGTMAPDMFGEPCTRKRAELVFFNLDKGQTPDEQRGTTALTQCHPAAQAFVQPESGTRTASTAMTLVEVV